MEQDFNWHGKPPNKEEGEKALQELRTLRGKIKGGIKIKTMLNPNVKLNPKIMQDDIEQVPTRFGYGGGW